MNEMTIQQRALLIVDSDPLLEKALSADPRSSIQSVIFVNSPRKSVSLLVDKGSIYGAIFVNPLISSPGIFEWIRTARKARPLTPLFLIEEKTAESAFEKLQLERLGVRGVIEKPCSLEKLWAAAKLFPLEPVSETAKGPVDIFADAVSEEFRAVEIEECFTEVPQLFDVYVRRESGEFVDILRAGERFSPKLLRAHARRGVKKLYIRNDTVERSLGFCRTLSMTLPYAHGLSAALQQRSELNSWESVTDRLKETREVSAEDVETAREFTGRASEFVTTLDCRSNLAMRKLFDFVSSTDQAVATTIVSAKLAPNLGLENEASVQILGVASLLHNIGLYRLPEKLWDEDETKMTENEKALYQTHPELGANILRKVEGIHPTVIQAVAQHHERKGGRGFPGKVLTVGLSPIGEAVGISNEFVKLICRKNINPEINIEQELDKNVFPLFSLPIVRAFKAAFWGGA